VLSTLHMAVGTFNLNVMSSSDALHPVLVGTGCTASSFSRLFGI
jgi:hypothetical protein